MKDVEELLSTLSAKLRIPELFLDDNDTCELIFDNQYRIELLFQPAKNQLILAAKLGRYSDAASAREFEKFLVANLFWNHTDGATLSVEPVNHEVFIHRKLYYSGMNDGDILTAVEKFVNEVEYWTKDLKNEEAKVAEMDDDNNNTYASLTNFALCV